MAKFDLKFIDCTDETTLSVSMKKPDDDFILEFYPNGIIQISITPEDSISRIIYLDKSTAIKFAKTLRTEINKITESEVSNG